MITFLRNLIFKDFWLKLFSLTLAILIWFTVSLAIPKEGFPAAALALKATERHTFSNLPVVVMSSASDVRNFKVNPNEVAVTVEGDPKILQNLQSKDIRVIVDLTGVEAARDMTKRIDVSIPAGVTLVRVDPQEVHISNPPKG